MSSLHEQLQVLLQGRVCLVGIGNLHQGDDGAGIVLARELERRRPPDASGHAPIDIRTAGTEVEEHVSDIIRRDFDSVLFLDAVDFGGPPGAAVLYPCGEIRSRFPQTSTHRLSLGLLAQMIAASRGATVSMLGIQPAQLRRGAALSRSVDQACRALVEVLADVLWRGTQAPHDAARPTPAAVPAEGHGLAAPVLQPVPC